MDLTLWKINDITFEALGIESPRVRYVNGAADIFTWDDPLTAFDANLRWAYDANITLTRGEVVVFRGKVRKTPRFLGEEAESISYEAQGAWALLEERAYLQFYNFAADPEAAESELEPKALGRVVLGLRINEAGEGEKMPLDEALTEIITASGTGITVGDIGGLDFPVPLDEAVDLQCTDAMGRLLQWAPDVVEWFDYDGEAPVYNAARRAELEAVSLLVPAPGQGGLTPTSYVPLETIRIEPAYHLQAPAVVLFFRRSTEATNGVFAAYEKQAAPETATGLEPRAIVRTLDLAGATQGGGRLTQPVRTEPLSALLQTAGTVLPAAEEAFQALSTFWKRKLPRLAQATAITGFQKLTRKRVPAGADDPNQSATPTAECLRELVEGALTDWMLEQYSTLKVESQVLTARIAFTEVVDGITVSRVEDYTTKVTATSANTKVYRERGGFVEVGEPGEPAEPGLAAKIWDGVKDLHYSGTFTLVEEEAALNIRPGVVVNLTGSRAEWTTMRALVQSVEVDIEAGRTAITVGPPDHLGPQQLQELFRSNRTRRDVASASARITGRID